MNIQTFSLNLKVSDTPIFQTGITQSEDETKAPEIAKELSVESIPLGESMEAAFATHVRVQEINSHANPLARLDKLFDRFNSFPKETVQAAMSSPVTFLGPIRPFSIEDFKKKGRSKKWEEAAETLAKCQREYPNIRFLEIDELTDRFNSGVMSQLFSTTYQGKEIVYKLQKHPAGGNERNPYPYYKGSIGERGMLDSLHNVLTTLKLLEKLKYRTCFPEFIGVIYVKDKDQFGWAFEKIKGENLGQWRNDMSMYARDYFEFDNYLADLKRYFNIDRKTVEHRNERPTCMRDNIVILRDYAVGLKVMDDAGYSHNDLKALNVMIAYPEKRGVLVDFEGSSYYSPISCRHAFGCILYQMLNPDVQFMLTYAPKEYDKVLTPEELEKKGVPSKLIQLLQDCWSYKSMEECSWEHIINELTSVL